MGGTQETREGDGGEENELALHQSIMRSSDLRRRALISLEEC